MRSLKLLLFTAVLTLTLSGCDKEEDKTDEVANETSQETEEDEAPTGSQLLMSKSWTSTRIFNSGKEVTKHVSPITYKFKPANRYSSSSSAGSSDGSWSLKDNTLKLDGRNWTVLELKSNSLKIDDNATVRIYLH